MPAGEAPYAIPVQGFVQFARACVIRKGLGQRHMALLGQF